MKNLGLVLAVVASFSASASECKYNQAQFVGNVTELRVQNLGDGKRDCSYKISFTEFSANSSCPLEYSLASSFEFEDYLCEKKLSNGDQVSGTLTEKNGYILLK